MKHSYLVVCRCFPSLGDHENIGLVPRIESLRRLQPEYQLLQSSCLMSTCATILIFRWELLYAHSHVTCRTIKISAKVQLLELLSLSSNSCISLYFCFIYFSCNLVLSAIDSGVLENSHKCQCFPCSFYPYIYIDFV